MLSAAELQPYINLLTWQVIAVAGGMVFGPAVYIFVLRIRKIAGVELSSAEVRELETQAKEAAEERFGEEAIATPVEVAVDAKKAIEEIANDDASDDLDERYSNVANIEATIAGLVRSLARIYGLETKQKRLSTNVKALEQKGAISKDEASRLLKLRQRKEEFRREPKKMKTPLYRGFTRSANTLAGALTDKIRLIGTGELGEKPGEARPN